MANRIQIRRGAKADMPAFAEGELGFTTDTHELFAGTGSGNVNLSGNMFYTGTAMSGTGTGKYYRECPSVKVGDMYININSGDIYKCTTAGSDTKARWAYTMNITGPKGDKGDKGDDGENGTGTNGKGIGSVSVTYQSSSSGTTEPNGTWQSTIPTVGEGNYLWTRLVITYTDSTSTTAYSVAKQGAKGETGTGADSRGRLNAAGTSRNNIDENIYGALVVGSSNDIRGSNSGIIGSHNKILYGLTDHEDNGLEQAFNSFVAGVGCEAVAETAMALGRYLKAHWCQLVIGSYNKEYEGSSDFGIGGNAGSAFIIGNGDYEEDIRPDADRSNAFRVTYAGNVYGTGAYNSTGADYAEMFEWEDGNPNNEDRRGLFAYVVNGKIRLATEADTDKRRLGIISARPAVVGDNYAEDWHEKYLTDIFGEILTETVHVDAKYKDIEVTDPETGETVTKTVCVRKEHDAQIRMINPDYDPDKVYIPREQRPEYALWSFIGKLVVVDDCTCVEGGYCYPGKDGVATACTDPDKGYYVMERLDDTHIKVLVR